jgi:hypothetical protein
MTDIGSSLLKFTDFPFIWTFVGLVSLLVGNEFDFDDFKISEILPFLLIVGVIGTTLSITDPLGNLLKFLIKRHLFDFEYLYKIYYILGNYTHTVIWFIQNPIDKFKGLKEIYEKKDKSYNKGKPFKVTYYLFEKILKDRYDEYDTLSDAIKDINRRYDRSRKKEEDAKQFINRTYSLLASPYSLGANPYSLGIKEEITDIDTLKDNCISTNIISKEIDKTVSLLYFEILIGFFMVLVFTSNIQILEDKIKIINCLSNDYCNFFQSHYKILLLSLSLLAFSGVSLIIYSTIKKLKRLKIKIVIDYFLSIYIPKLD